MRLRDTQRKGLAVVEFAIIAPILVFLTVGILEMSHGYQVKEVLSDAARRGCRTAVTPGKTNSDVTTDVNDVLTKNNISTSNATTTITVGTSTTADVSTATSNQKITVEVSILVSKVAWVSPVFLPGTSKIKGTVVMMHQEQ